jgi:hypothetical protein
LLVGSLVAPAAAREYSIWEWWTDQAMTNDDLSPVHPPWGAAYSAYTHDDVWDQMDIGKETWVIPAAPFNNGKTTLRVEYSAYKAVNTFGWYSATDGMNEIFNGAAGLGAVATIDFSGATSPIGFYIQTPYDTWYSEAGSNSDTSTHVRVFDSEMCIDSWVLAWEDQPMTTTNPVVYDYAAAWDKSNEPLKWHYETGEEPDYNDMILTFTWVDDDGNCQTPELSTIVLLGLSLAAVPVLRRRRRS